MVAGVFEFQLGELRQVEVLGALAVNPLAQDAFMVEGDLGRDPKLWSCLARTLRSLSFRLL